MADIVWSLSGDAIIVAPKLRIAQDERAWAYVIDERVAYHSDRPSLAIPKATARPMFELAGEHDVMVIDTGSLVALRNHITSATTTAIPIENAPTEAMTTGDVEVVGAMFLDGLRQLVSKFQAGYRTAIISDTMLYWMPTPSVHVWSQSYVTIGPVFADIHPIGAFPQGAEVATVELVTTQAGAMLRIRPIGYNVGAIVPFTMSSLDVPTPPPQPMMQLELDENAIKSLRRGLRGSGKNTATVELSGNQMIIYDPARTFRLAIRGSGEAFGKTIVHLNALKRAVASIPSARSFITTKGLVLTTDGVTVLVTRR